MLCRRPISRSARPAARRLPHRAVRHALRRLLRRAPRHVLKDNGPSLSDVCNAVSAYLRAASAWDDKWNPPSRVKSIGTQEERRRQMEADLERAYGENSPVVRARDVSPSVALALPPALVTSGTPEPPRPQPPPKCDAMTVPLVRLPSGLLSLDWSRARPAS
jgi:hypothetical protein